eukprot:sb/3473337/
MYRRWGDWRINGFRKKEFRINTELLHKITNLESLETVRLLCLLPDNIVHLFDQLSPLGIIPLGPVVTRTTRPKDEGVGVKCRTPGTTLDGVYGAWLQVHTNRPWDVSVGRGGIKNPLRNIYCMIRLLVKMVYYNLNTCYLQFHSNTHQTVIT